MQTPPLSRPLADVLFVLDGYNVIFHLTGKGLGGGAPLAARRQRLLDWLGPLAGQCAGVRVFFDGAKAEEHHEGALHWVFTGPSRAHGADRAIWRFVRAAQPSAQVVVSADKKILSGCRKNVHAVWTPEDFLAFMQAHGWPL